MGSRKLKRTRRVADAPPAWEAKPDVSGVVVSPVDWGEVWRRVGPMAGAAAASPVWTRQGPAWAVAFAILLGASIGLVRSRKDRSRRASKPTPLSALPVVALGCLWITAASAVLAALLMRYVGVPFLETAVPLYVVIGGSMAFAGFWASAREGRPR